MNITVMRGFRACGALLVAAMATAGVGCRGSSTDLTPRHSVSASVNGLNGSGLVLAINDSLVPVSNGTSSITLVAKLSAGSFYLVAVSAQPAGQTCSVANGGGIIYTADIANVVVTCSALAYAVGGSISGLSGPGLVLANGSETLQVAAGATGFSLTAPVAYQSNYDVTVRTQPPGLACSVTNGTGMISTGPVTNIVVRCTDQPFALGGTISGLGNGFGLQLANGSDVLTVPGGSTQFVMPGLVAFGSPYAVTVLNSPAGLSCSAANSVGTMGAANVRTVSITCSDRSYALGGSITGLTQPGLVLANGSDTLNVPAGSSAFTMGASVAFASSYDVQVQTNPVGATCSTSQGVGTMPASAVSNVVVTCALNAYTVGGSITGLALPGLVLLDNGADATPIAANATQFSMHTAVAFGAPYDVTVGVQPYGVRLTCVPSANTGTVAGPVADVAISCADTPPVPRPIESYFNIPTAVAVDASGNVFVADSGNSMIRKFPYQNGQYGLPIQIGTGFSDPEGVAVDASGNVFVADSGNNALKAIPYVNGGYANTTTIATGFSGPKAVAVDAAGNLYVADTGNNQIQRVSWDQNSYGAPTPIATGFSGPAGVAVDAAGNVFVSDTGNNALKEVPYSGGVYGSPLMVDSGLSAPRNVAVDISGNLYVADSNSHRVIQLPYSSGAYGPAVTVSSAFAQPSGVAIDAAGNLFISDAGTHDYSYNISKFPYLNGTYGNAVALNAPLSYPEGIAVDGGGNLFVADSANGRIEEFPYVNGGFGAPRTVATGLRWPAGIAVDAAGNVYTAEVDNSDVVKVPFANGSYGSPIVVSSGLSGPWDVRVDSTGNVIVADTGNGAIKVIPFANGSYATPIAIASGLNTPYAVTVDASGNVFAADSGSGEIVKIPYNNGSYGAPTVIAAGLATPDGIVVDALGNVFASGLWDNSLVEISLSNGSYGSPVAISTDFLSPQNIAIDSNGRVYVVDLANIWIVAP